MKLIKLISYSEFRKFFFTQFFFKLADNLLRLVLTISVTELGGIGYLTRVFTAQSLMVLIMILFISHLADYVSPKKLLIIAAIAKIFAVLLILFVIKNPHLANIYLLIVGLFLGAGDSLFIPSYQVTLKQKLPKDYTEEGVSLINISKQLLNIFSPIVFAAFLISLSIGFSFIVVLTLYIFSFISMVFLKRSKVVEKRSGQRFIPASLINVKPDFIYIKQHKWLLSGLLILFVFSPIQQSLSSTVVPSFILNFSGKADYAILTTFYSIGTFLGILIFMLIRKYMNKMSAISIAVLLGAVSYLSISLIQSIYFMFVCSLFIGMFVQIFSVSWENKVVKNVSEMMIAKITSISWVAVGAVTPIAMILIEKMVGLFGYRNVILFGMLMTIMLILVVIISTKVFNEDRNLGKSKVE